MISSPARLRQLDARIAAYSAKAEAARNERDSLAAHLAEIKFYDAFRKAFAAMNPDTWSGDYIDLKSGEYFARGLSPEQGAAELFAEYQDEADARDADFNFCAREEFERENPGMAWAE